MSDTLTATIDASMDATRHRLAEAPDWARAAIDSERAKRGLPALFVASAAAPAARVKPRGFMRTLVGVAAPAVSEPHRLDGQGWDARELLPEVIGEKAWLSVEADLLMGATFDFRCGHDGKPFVRSSDPDVSISFDPLCGMLFTIRGAAAQRFKWPGGGTASICFAPKNWVKRFTRSHGWVREITRMRLAHVALLPPHYDPPAYRAARVLSVPPEQEMKAFVNLRVDARLATKEALGR